MRKLIVVLAVLALGVCPALASLHYYSWEDEGTILGLNGSNLDGSPAIYATAVGWEEQVRTGNFALKLEDNLASGTPQAFLAFVWDLQPNDTVSALFWRYDDTPAAAPSCRLWGHWNDSLPSDYFGYDGSASGQSDYGTGGGWDLAMFDFINTDGHTGLVIECRTYSNPGDTIFIDDMEIMIPDHASIMIPNAGFVGTEARSFGAVKALFR
jgi:hypothetical protein